MICLFKMIAMIYITPHKQKVFIPDTENWKARDFMEYIHFNWNGYLIQQLIMLLN